MRNTDRQCWIGAGLVQPLIECRLVNISEIGATISFAGPVTIPSTCNLFFTADCVVGRKCIVESQSGREATVKFVARIEPPDKPGGADIVEI